MALDVNGCVIYDTRDGLEPIDGAEPPGAGGLVNRDIMGCGHRGGICSGGIRYERKMKSERDRRRTV